VAGRFPLSARGLGFIRSIIVKGGDEETELVTIKD